MQQYQIAFTDKDGHGSFKYIHIAPEESEREIIAKVSEVAESYLENLGTNMLGIPREPVRRFKVFKYDKEKEFDQRAAKKPCFVGVLHTSKRKIKIANGVWGTVNEYDYYIEKKGE